jgi:hypothetical protein
MRLTQTMDSLPLVDLSRPAQFTVGTLPDLPTVNQLPSLNELPEFDQPEDSACEEAPADLSRLRCPPTAGTLPDLQTVNELPSLHVFEDDQLTATRDEAFAAQVRHSIASEEGLIEGSSFDGLCGLSGRLQDPQVAQGITVRNTFIDLPSEDFAAQARRIHTIDCLPRVS